MCAIPVVASGGIGDGRGLAAALCLGAEGIEMGTRFVATRECIAHEAYKQALIQGRETDTILIERSLGRPGRALHNAFADAIVRAESEGRPQEEVLALVSGAVNRTAAIAGDLEHGFVWAGQVMGLINDMPTVRDLLQRMVEDAQQRLRAAGNVT